MKKIRAALPGFIDLVGITGAGLISWGAALIYLPAGLIVGGGLLLAAAILASR